MSKVYWIHRESQIDPSSDGYIGVSENLEKRIAQHYRESKTRTHINKHLSSALRKYSDIKVDVLYEGSIETCYQKENEYRPSVKIGWNIAIGGETPSTIGLKHSKKFRQKRSKDMLGNTFASGNKGKPKSEEHKAKIAAALKGKKRSKKWCDAISRAKKGKKQSREVIKARVDGYNKARKERLRVVV